MACSSISAKWLSRCAPLASPSSWLIRNGNREFLHDPGRIEQFLEVGCLVQVSSGSVTDTRTRADLVALQDWFRRGIVHFLGSDGHSPRRRRPLMADAYRLISEWAGVSTADRICSTNGMALVHGVLAAFPAALTPEKELVSLFGKREQSRGDNSLCGGTLNVANHRASPR